MLRDIPPTISAAMRRRINRENDGHVNAAFDSTDFEVVNAEDGDVVSHIRPFSRSVAKAMNEEGILEMLAFRSAGEYLEEEIEGVEEKHEINLPCI